MSSRSPSVKEPVPLSCPRILGRPSEQPRPSHQEDAQTAIIEASALWATAAFPAQRIFNNLAEKSAKKLEKKRPAILLPCPHSRAAIARQEPGGPKDLLGTESGLIGEISIFSKKVIGRGLWY